MFIRYHILINKTEVSMSINILHKDPKLHILGFLDHRDLANVSLVNKDFNKLASDKKLYSKEAWAVKEAFKKWKTAESETDKIQKNCNEINLKINDLNSQKISFFSYFVSLITFKSKKLSIITTIFETIFPSIKNEIRLREQSKATISELKSDLNTQRQNLQKQSEDSSKLEIQFRDLKKPFKLKQNLQSDFQKIMDLFGGKEEYMKLPELKLNRSLEELREAHNRMIKYENMTAPIMRGQYENGCNFVTFRIKNSPYCLTCFQNSCNDRDWGVVGIPNLPSQNIMVNGKINEKFAIDLKSAISTKTIKLYSKALGELIFNIE